MTIGPRFLLLALLLCPLQAANAQGEEDSEWVVRQPADFRDLPEPIRRSLEQRECAITQDTAWHQPHNIVRGHFEHPGQEDWVVLCVRRSSSTILIYWAGLVTRLDSLSVPIPAGHPTVAVADTNYIRVHAENYGWPEDLPRQITHDGIEVGSGCCSQIYYRYQGRWILTPGAD